MSTGAIGAWLAAAFGAFLIGSIPFGVILGRAHGVDIRDKGSRNIGATNVGRVLGRRWGILCFLLDGAKGALPVLAAGAVAGALGRSADELGAATTSLWLLVVVAAILGHVFSPFVGFRGGKGVATAFGGLVAFWPMLTIPALVAVGVWLVVLVAGRIVSLASIAGAVALPAATLAFSIRSAAAWPLGAATILLAALVIVRHHANVGRLLRGEEPRLGRRAAANDPPASGAAPMQNAP